MSTRSSSTIERREVPPRIDVLRTAPFALRADDGSGSGDGNTLDGYAAVFNRETVIDSWEGKFRENISPGSMKKSFRESPPRIQFDHGRHPLIGAIPIARLDSIVEDTDPVLAPEGGAHVIGRLHDNWLIQPVRDAIASKSIDGMSFRFSVVREIWYDADGKQIRDEEKLREALRRTWYEDVPDIELLLRDLKELKVPEVGPVVWPAYEETSVGVRSKTFTVDLGRLHEPQMRTMLAQAVILADRAESDTDSTDPKGGTQTPDDETPRSTEDIPSAGEHDPSAETPDTPRATDPQGSAGEHESTPVRGKRLIDRWVRKARDVVIDIDSKGSTS
jgi:HK97 family phage prohead protease